MISIGSAFLNNVYTFYTFYQYIREPREDFLLTSLVLIQYVIYWSVLVVTVIQSAHRVNREVFY